MPEITATNMIDAGQTVTCPRCEETLPAEVKYCPFCGAGQKQTLDRVPVIFIILLICSSVLLLSSSYVTATKDVKVSDEVIAARKEEEAKAKANKPTEIKDMNQSAYFAAKRFVEEQYPNATRISGQQESSVSHSGNIYQIVLFVDAMKDNSAVRNNYRVSIELDKGKWKLTEIAE